MNALQKKDSASSSTRENSKPSKLVVVRSISSRSSAMKARCQLMRDLPGRTCLREDEFRRYKFW